MVSIAGLDKADVLAALYNASRPLGMGLIHYDATPMTKEQAAKYLESTDYFDYLNGRVMKVSIKGDELSEYLYDRDNGHGSAARAIAGIPK